MPPPAPPNAAAVDAAPVQLDAGALAQLRALDPGDRKGIFARVLQTYHDVLRRQLDEMDAARAGADWDTARRLVHTLKSSSASIGALDFARHCHALEGALHEGRTEGAAEALAALRLEGEAVRSAVHAMLRAR